MAGRNGAPSAVGLTPDLVRSMSPLLDGGVTDGQVPEHVRSALEAHTETLPEPCTVALTPCPDPQAQRRVWERSVVSSDLRIRSEADELSVARASERLLDAFSVHLEGDLGLPPGRAEALVRAVGYLLWFARHHAGIGPLDLDVDLVRTCFGNYYIRRHRGPELDWILFGLRGAAAFVAFLHRLGWAEHLDVTRLLGLPEDAGWFRDRLEDYWLADGDALGDWAAEYDYERL